MLCLQAFLFDFCSTKKNDFIFEKRIKAYEFEILHAVKSASTNVQNGKGKGMIGCAIIFNSEFLEKL